MTIDSTTDNQEEQFTQVDEEDNVIGPVSRRKAHKDKQIIHRSVGIFLINPQQEMLFQQRSLTKDKDPGAWSFSVGGHVTFNEEYETSAKRELFEELGISTELTFITKSIIHMQTETEFSAFFVAKLINNPHILLQTAEISSIQWVSTSTISEFIKSHTLTSWAMDGLKITGYLP